jgi:hypothetical protein
MKRPNIVYIVADDLGYADLGCYGGRAAKFGAVSPVLDAIAADGIKFTQGYANSPVCSPTRFALMTGRYQYRLRGAAEEPINSKSRGSSNLGLPPAHPTLPSLLRNAGYQTALMGKWHLGYPPYFGPLMSGYDEFFGPMSGGVDYFTHRSSAAADGSELRPQGAHLAGGVRHLGLHLVQGSGQGELAGVTLAQLFGPGLVVTALALQAGQGFAAGRLALAGRLARLGQLREGSLDLAQGAAGGGIALLQLTMPLLEGLQLGRKFAAFKLG